MTRFGTSVRKLTLGLLSLILGGCTLLAPQPDLSQFFVLTSLSPTAAGTTAYNLKEVSVGLGPVSFPAYLDRPQMVTRVAPNRVEFSPTDRWAEPLETNFSHVMVQNLKVLLKTDAVVAYPWFATTRLDYQIPVDVLRFERQDDGSARLLARWTVKDGRGKQLLETRDSDLVEPPATNDIEGSVAAMSAVVGDLSRQIAGAVAELRSQKP